MRPQSVGSGRSAGAVPDLVTPLAAAYLSDMRFAQDSFATNSIRAYSDGDISLNEKVINHSVIITTDVNQLWEPATIGELTADHC